VNLDDHPMFIDDMTKNEIDYPERLTLEMTSYCNLRCWMCPKTAGYVNTPANQIISEEVIKKVGEILPEIEVLQLSGLWGEVFLHPEVYLRILKMAKAEGCEVRTISNGTLLTPELSGKLVDTGLDNLTISIDAATKNTYKKIRVGGNFKTLTKQIKKLQKIKKKKSKQRPSIHFGFVGMKSNIYELPDLVRLAGKLGVESVILQGMGEFDKTRGESLAFHDRQTGKEIYREASKIGESLGVVITLFPPDQFDEDSIRVDPPRGVINEHLKITVPEGYRKTCDVPWKETVITTSGDVLPCCAATKPIGNILQTPFKEIWLSHAYKEFRRKVVSKKPPAMCITCTGVGWRKDTVLKDYLKMGDTDGQLGLGWYHLEVNPFWERTYRWSKKRSVFFLRNSGQDGKIALEMRMAEQPKEGEIFINNQSAGTFFLEKSAWEKCDFNLPEETKKEALLKVELQVKNPSKEGEDRRKSLGVALSEATLN